MFPKDFYIMEIAAIVYNFCSQVSDIQYILKTYQHIHSHIINIIFLNKLYL